MAYLPEAFDASTVQPSAPLEPLAPGTYTAIIRDSEMKDTKSGTGQLLQLTLEVSDGPQKGRVLFDRLNLVNTNKMTVEIAHKTLSAICHAVGVLRVRDSSELHHKPLRVTVDVRKQDGYSASNEVKGYAPLAGAASVQAPAGAAPAPAATATPPWAS